MISYDLEDMSGRNQETVGRRGSWHEGGGRREGRRRGGEEEVGISGWERQKMDESGKKDKGGR